jgi:hypothetical protein
MLRTNGSQAVDRQWDVETCPFLDCDYIHEKYDAFNKHIRTHNDTGLPIDIKSLGWFWGSMRTMLQGTSQATIAEAFGKGRV